MIIGDESIAVDLLHPHDDAALLESRYSHSGYIRQIRPGGVEILDMPRSPFAVFHGCGFPDEFEEPVGYDDASVGEGFLKIGVGVLERLCDRPYTNWDRHPVLQPAEHAVRSGETGVVFRQQARRGGYGYAYAKSVDVLPGGRIRVSHQLTNTGALPLHSSWYSHAFLSRSVFGRATTLRLPQGYAPAPGNDLAHRDGACAMPAGGPADTADGVCCWWRVPPGTVHAHRLTSGDGILYHGKGDFTAESFMLYVNDRILSPEPRIRLSLAPRQEQSWSTEIAIRMPA